MEKQKPFTLFVPPRLSSSQVSAVKPQTAGGDSNYFKTVNKCTEGDFGVPFTMSSRENIDKDPAFQKLSILPMLEQVANSGSCHYQEGVNDSDFENSEPMSRLYSKLYKEAEKIKKWKVSIESELKQKENKLQENRKIIEAQRKAIQELQFENEKVSLKLEEEIQENKDLIKDTTSAPEDEISNRYPRTDRSGFSRHNRDANAPASFSSSSTLEKRIEDLEKEVVRERQENLRLVRLMQDKEEMIGKLKEEIDLLNRDLDDMEDENEQLKQENKTLLKVVGQLTRPHVVYSFSIEEENCRC